MSTERPVKKQKQGLGDKSPTSSVMDGNKSPTSVMEVLSSTSSPRNGNTVKPPMKMSLLTPDEADGRLNAYRSGDDSVKLPSPIKQLEDERKKIHPSLLVTWDKHPEQREHLHQRSKIIYRQEKDREELDRKKKEENARKYEEYVASLDPIDRPALIRKPGQLDDPYTAYYGRYIVGDERDYKEMDESGLTFGGKKRKTKKNKRSKKYYKKSVKKSKKSMKKSKKYKKSRTFKKARK